MNDEESNKDQHPDDTASLKPWQTPTLRSIPLRKTEGGFSPYIFEDTFGGLASS